MKQLSIAIPGYDRSYQIYIGSGMYDQIQEYIAFSQRSAVYIITDSTVGPLYAHTLKESLEREIKNIPIHLFEFEAGEKQKLLSTVERILVDMARVRLDRKSLVINIGGGVVTDLGGFAASIYQRGLAFVNIPTTLEAMVDASVGGKTGVNLGDNKNYIGTFSQPQAVIIDTSTLTTLPKRTFIQGYAEVLKHGLIFDSDYFHTCVSNHPTEISEENLENIIKRSLEIKSYVVSQDEKEAGIRKILNFGHTVGHAIESMSFHTSHPLYHGEAVAIGTVAEAKLSHLLGMISDTDFEAVENGVKHAGLPIRIPNSYTRDKIIAHLAFDKKNSKGKIKWVLLTGIGKADFNIEVSETYIKKAVSYIIEEY